MATSRLNISVSIVSLQFKWNNFSLFVFYISRRSNSRCCVRKRRTSHLCSSFQFSFSKFTLHCSHSNASHL